MTENIVNIDERRASFRKMQQGSSVLKSGATAVLVNILVLYIRPQNDLTALAAIQMPFILSLFPFVFWLTQLGNTWSKQMKIMLFILLQGAIWVPLALNNRYAFDGFRVLAQLFLGIIFPLTIFLTNGVQLRRLVNVLVICALYLTLYSVTHGAHGPGDFLGDENDLCLCLDMFLGLLLAFGATKKGLARVVIQITTGLLVAAIILTGSRGGFLGFIATLLCHLWYSERKARIIAVAFIILLGAAIFAPAKYWERISTMTQTKQGSALERQETWGFAWNLFTRKDVFLVGVGMKNTPVHLGAYKTSTSRNLWGRQTHSLYFELLPDLGLLGFSLFLTLVTHSFRTNTKRYKQLRLLEKRIPPELAEIRNEIKVFRSFLLGTNAAWVAVLVSGAFISIFYYPHIWFLAGISGALEIYARKLVRIATFEKATSNKKLLLEF